MLKFVVFVCVLFFIAYMTNVLGFADMVRHKTINFQYERNDAKIIEKLYCGTFAAPRIY